MSYSKNKRGVMKFPAYCQRLLEHGVELHQENINKAEKHWRNNVKPKEAAKLIKGA